MRAQRNLLDNRLEEDDMGAVIPDGGDFRSRLHLGRYGQVERMRVCSTREREKKNEKRALDEAQMSTG